MFAWILIILMALFCGLALWRAQSKGISAGQAICNLARRYPILLVSAAFPLSALLVAGSRDFYSVESSIAAVAIWIVAAFVFKRWRAPLEWNLLRTVDRAMPGLLTVAGLAVLVAISTFFYENEPFVSDSCIELAHAQIFNSGRMKLTPPPPELLPFLNNVYGLVREGVWRSQYFPGHILTVAAFNAFGVPWLTNPLLGAAALWLVFSIGNSLHDRKTGLLAATLLLFSPFFLILQSEMMSHGSTLFYCLAAVRLLCCPWKNDAPKRPIHWEWLGGFCLGMALASRPLSALPTAAAVILLPPGTWAAPRPAGQRRWLAAFLGGLIPIAFLLFDNYVATGSPFKAGYHLTHPELHQLGFHGDFTWRVGLSNSLDKLANWNVWLFGWPFSYYLTVGILFGLRKARRSDWILLAMTFLLLFAYTFYVFHDNFLGPRFLYESQGWMAILAARGCAEIFRLLRRLLEGCMDRKLLARACMLALIPFLAAGPITAAELMTDHNYRGLIVSRREMLLEPIRPLLDDPNAVVFVRFEHTDYLLIYNMRFYPQGPLFALDRKEENAVFMRAFPGRKFYMLDRGVLTPLASGERGS